VVLAGWFAWAFVVPAAAQVQTPRTNAAVQVVCDQSVTISVSTATTTELVALDAAKRVYVCAFVLNSVGAAVAPTAQFVRGTGTACGTGTTALTGVLRGSVTVGEAETIAAGSGVGALFAVPKGSAVCLTSTTTQPQTGVLTYAQF
jgi:hypothetical protein